MDSFFPVISLILLSCASADSESNGVPWSDIASVNTSIWYPQRPYLYHGVYQFPEVDLHATTNMSDHGIPFASESALAQERRISECNLEMAYWMQLLNSRDLYLPASEFWVASQWKIQFTSLSFYTTLNYFCAQTAFRFDVPLRRMSHARHNPPQKIHSFLSHSENASWPIWAIRTLLVASDILESWMLQYFVRKIPTVRSGSYDNWTTRVLEFSLVIGIWSKSRTLVFQRSHRRRIKALANEMFWL